jgi:hypothetical protein
MMTPNCLNGSPRALMRGAWFVMYVRRSKMNDYKLSERITRVVFLVALIVLALDVLVWRV